MEVPLGRYTRGRIAPYPRDLGQEIASENVMLQCGRG